VQATAAVIGELAAYAALLLLVPAIFMAQKIHDWWADPINVFWRRVWLTEHLRVAPQPSPRRATLDRDSACVHRAAVEGGSQQPVAVGEPPDSAATGVQPHPRDEEVAGATVPRTAAPATQPAGAAPHTAPARGVA
jgi:hypothetical protein